MPRMTRRRRKEVQKALREVSPDWRPTWPVNQDIWFECPLCGMKALAERLDDSPYVAQVFVQYYGGKRPDGRGYNEWLPAPEKIAATIMKHLNNAIKRLVIRQARRHWR